MSTRQSASAAAPASNALPLLLLLFVGSGLCALIYEVVWFQLLELVIGSSAISLGVLLATFMGGMCIGSLALPRLLPTHHHPLRVYAALELGIGVIGLLVLGLVPLVGALYSPAVGHGAGAIVMRAVVAALCLLPPTILMGATLPAIARWIESSPRGVSWLGFFYGGNTAGAVIGAMFAGFYLLRRYDLSTATFVAAALNAAVAGAAWLLAKNAPSVAQIAPDVADVSFVGRGAGGVAALPFRWVVYVGIALSGLAALGAEVVWTRLLSLMLGASTYTFSIILAVFLAGLGIGSAGGSAMARRLRNPRLAFGWVQALQMVMVAYGAWMIADVLPYWPINPSLAPSPVFTMHLDVTRAAWAVLPSAVLWGASFPLALAAVAGGEADSGRLVGGVYAANTVGAIIGALLFSLVLVPQVGTHGASQALVIVSAVAALLLFASELFSTRIAAQAALVTTLVGAVAIVPRVAEVPALLVAYGRYMVTWLGQLDVVYVGEGMNSSIAVATLKSSGATQFHVAGKVEASNLSQDMKLQRMLAHLPALVHPNPKSVLIVGFGAGVTAGSFVPYPGVEHISICEIEPLIPQVVSTYFKKENNDVMHDHRTEITFDDARSFILTTRDKYDVITSDPIHPWVKGAAALYTKEYFEAVKAHLNPGGVVTQWVPLYESNLEAVKSEVATFLAVFPTGTVWANNMEGKGYDVVLLGQNEPLKIDIPALEQRMRDPKYAAVAASLMEVGFQSPLDLFSTFAASASDLKTWVADAQINRDRNLRLQYLAGTGLNTYEGGPIFSSMVRGRAFPDDLFTATPEWKAALRARIGQ
ncbi:MAG: fused MFS/spermidine synthase [Gemmatimonadetes bacterium]|nr:fused MFS/spermidine synthase [Gemmatimonadota bacterium]